LSFSSFIDHNSLVDGSVISGDSEGVAFRGRGAMRSGLQVKFNADAHAGRKARKRILPVAVLYVHPGFPIWTPLAYAPTGDSLRMLTKSYEDFQSVR